VPAVEARVLSDDVEAASGRVDRRLRDDVAGPDRLARVRVDDGDRQLARDDPGRRPGRAAVRRLDERNAVRPRRGRSDEVDEVVERAVVGSTTIWLPIVCRYWPVGTITCGVLRVWPPSVVFENMLGPVNA
jgi:hypothetical protein